MNKKKEILLSFLVLLFSNIPSIKSQNIHRCGTVEYEQFILSNNIGLQSKKDEIERAVQNYIELNEFQNFKTANTIIKIPIVVHIIGDHAISLVGINEVTEQINILNQDFRKIIGTNGNGNGVDTKIEFCLALIDQSGSPTGGVFTYSGTYAEWDKNAPDADANSDLKLKSIAHWFPTEYLNVYVADLSGGYLGYAKHPWSINYLPERDGVVIDPDNFGNNSTDIRYNAGRTATHEVGHWLGLKHTWGDGDCTVDDEVDDTPICDDSNYPYALYSNNCDPHPPQCPTENTAAGLTDLRQIENYMEYSDDLCMNMFTQGQADRMLGYLNTVRLYTLFSSCEPNHCDNGIQDSDETGIDCGGQDCPACTLPPVDEYTQCDACFGLWPNFRINGVGPEQFRVRICTGDFILITPGTCKFWDCFDTFFSIQECNYYATRIGTEFSTWFQSPDVEWSLYNLVTIAGGTLQEGKYYIIKFANNFPTSQGGYGWTERTRMIYVVPENLYYNNVTMGANFPEYSYALNNIVITGNSTIQNGHAKIFIAQNEISIGSGFSAEVGSAISIKTANLPCPTFRLTNSDNNNSNTRSKGGNNSNGSLQSAAQNSESKNGLRTPNSQLKLYPNPSDGKFQLAISNGQWANGNVQITIYNVLGEKVYSAFNIQHSTFNIDISTQPTGIYHCHVVVNGEIKVSEKLVIIK